MGRRLHSASYTSVEEAILLRHQVSNLADAGPSEVARTWLQWAQELRHRRGRKWCWSKQKAEGIFSERKKSEIPYGRGIKSLKLRVQHAEAALLEVARDAVSAAKRRWMPLSEATKRYPRCPSMADKVMELCQGRSWCHKDIELHRVAAADRAQLPRGQSGGVGWTSVFHIKNIEPTRTRWLSKRDMGQALVCHKGDRSALNRNPLR
eukprot:symbB.v1.2.032545.t1/scaffold3919.1/size48322/7